MNKILEEIIREEGFREYPYRDSLGIATIGYGFNVDPDKPGDPIPKSVANLWLLEIVKSREAELDKEIPWWKNLSETRQRALLNMSYQLGVNGLLKFKKMLQALQDGRYIEAGMEALQSKWAKQTPERAKRISEMIARG